MSPAAALRSVGEQEDGPVDLDRQLKPVDQKESAGAATIARADFVAAEVCQQIDDLIAAAKEHKQIVLQDAEFVKSAVELLVESGKAASEFASHGNQILAELRSRRAKLVKGE